MKFCLPQKIITYSFKKCPSYILKILPQNKDIRFSIKNIDQTEIITPQKKICPKNKDLQLPKNCPQRIKFAPEM